MFRRVVTFISTSMLLASPAMAQFGVGGNRKKSSSFQELNEQAKQLQQDDGLDLGGLEDLLGGLDDAELMNMLAELGPQMEEVMKMLSDMSPEELEKQMKEALSMFGSGDMMENMMEHQDELLKALEESGQVDAEELEKFKKDPEYFEQKMKESLGQMTDLFSDPNILKAATESMQGLSELYANPDVLGNMIEELLEDFNDDEKIEEVRQMFLNNPELGHPALAEMFDSDEMKEILNDPTKWRESVKEGQGLLNQGIAAGQAAGDDAAGAAGVGEL